MDDRTPEPKGILDLATKITKPLPLAALGILSFVVIVLWLIAANSDNPLFARVMNFLFIIVLVVVVLAFVAYLLTTFWARPPQAKPAAGAVVLAGNVYYPGEVKAPGAAVTADGVMGNTTSDGNGWWMTQAEIKAVVSGYAASRESGLEAGVTEPRVETALSTASPRLGRSQ